MSQEVTMKPVTQSSFEQAVQQPDSGVFSGYKGGAKMPLAAYAGLMGVFGALSVGLLLVAKKSSEQSFSRKTYGKNFENTKNATSSGQTQRERINLSDIAIGSIATYKLSRVISKDRVTSPLRAPFTEFQEPAGASEVNEKSRGTGMQRAIGDLLTCPYCMGPWVATALAYGFVARPRTARLVSGIFTAVTVSDLLHHATDAIKKKEKEG